MDLTEKLFGSQRAVTILVVSVIFAVVFPVYFSIMDSGISAADGGSSGAKGQWKVEFVEANITLDDTARLADQEQWDSIFDLDTEDIVGYVEITISCNDNDDPGPGFTDSVDVETDFSGVEGTPDDEQDSGNCNGVAAQFQIQITPGYDGQSYIADDVSKSEIEAQWSDNGSGRGEWITSVTMNVNSPPGPIVGDIIDSDEDVTVTWRAATFKLEITAVEGEV